MSGLRKRRSGSMFRWYFIQTTVSVLLCLTIAGFAMLFFFLNFWKTDKLTALKEDALSVSQSVESFFVTNPSSAQENDRQALLYTENIISTIADSSDCDIFIASAQGKIILCSDAENLDDAVFCCDFHADTVITSEIITSVAQSGNDGFTYDSFYIGKSSEKYLLGAVEFSTPDGALYVIAVQPESLAFLPYTTEFTRMMILSGVIAVFISFILSVVISYRMVRPLKKVTEATKHYAGGDFSARINTSDVYKELTQLVDSVNKMADNLAVLEQSRSSFVANVSHELKTPMTVISGFVDGMLDGTISPDDSQKYLTIVSDEVKRLSRLVVSMLNMSKIEAGKLTLNTSVFSLREIFIKTIIGFEKFIEEKNIEIKGLDALENVIITADETLITQIIYNLLDNAVKFTGESGTITVSLVAEKKEAVFTVHNTGKGISKEERGLVFDRFYKVDKSRGLDAKSFGMGLYIVKSIIELHKGTISLETEENEFTEFTVKLPLQ